MFKTLRFSLIFLISLSHNMKCNDLDDVLEYTIQQYTTDLDSCSEFFKVVRIDDFIIGNLTLPNMQMGNNVKMIFHGHDFEFDCVKDFKGLLLPAGNSQEVINRVHNGQPISYRLDFPLAIELPLLMKIFINNTELCATKVNVSPGMEELVLQHTLEITSGFLPDFTHSPHIQNFAEVPSCGLANTKITINGLSPLTYGTSEMSRGGHHWPSAFYEMQASSMTLPTNKPTCDSSGFCEGKSGDVLLFTRNGCWMPQNVILAGLVFQQCSKHMKQDQMYCNIAKDISRLENYVRQQEQPVIGSLQEICGKSSMQVRSEHPWLVVVYEKTFTGLTFQCSGMLISSRTVLVSAKCCDIWNTAFYRLHLGRYDLSNGKENGIVAREIATIISHPSNDLVILQMKAIGFTQYIKPICLQPEESDRQLEMVGQLGTVTGWDVLKVCDKPKRQSVVVNIVPIKQCEMNYYNVLYKLCISHSYEYHLNDFLILKRNGRWYLRGVYETSADASFSLFDDIAENFLWIQDNTL